MISLDLLLDGCVLDFGNVPSGVPGLEFAEMPLGENKSPFTRHNVSGKTLFFLKASLVKLVKLCVLIQLLATKV